MTMLLCIAIVVAAFIVAACLAPGLPPVPTEHVTDAAAMLSADARQGLEGKLERYQAATGHEVIVWTARAVPRGESIEAFARRAFNGWGIGRKEHFDGVALFIALDNRELRIEVGKGLTDKLTAIERTRIIHSILKPQLRARRYEAAVAGGVDAILEAIGGVR